jgi:NAD(P)-dependent dehydrogenase (short-subunit alcohol dehydrogenase family)
MAGVFAADGYAVAILDINGAGAEATAKSVRELGRDALAVAVDIADVAAMRAAADAVRDHFGGCDVLCANAGVLQIGAIDRLTADDWRWVLSVNVFGTINTVTAFLPLLRARTGHRNIVLTSSAAANDPSILLGAYTASKYAVTGFGETLRMELAPEGIGVSILFPSTMLNPLLDNSRLARPAKFGPLLILEEDMTAMLEDRGEREEMEEIQKAMLEGRGELIHSTKVVKAQFAIRNLLADLANNEPYIITHGDYRQTWVRRQQAGFDAFDRMAASDAAG